MPSGIMYQIRTRVENVPGGPYYVNGYFSQTGGTAQSSANAWWAFLDVGLGSIPSGASWLLDSEVPLVDSVTGDLVGTESVTPQSRVGSGTLANFLPWSTQLVARWRTGIYVNSREVRGRTFIPGHDESFNVGGQPTITYTNATQTRQAALIASAGNEFVVWSPKNARYEVVTSGTTWTQWGSLRSRRP